MKKLLRSMTLIMLSLVVVCLIKQPVQAAPHEDFSLWDYKGAQYTAGDYSYVVIDNEAYIVNAAKTISGKVEIPSQLGGYPVTFIYGARFMYNDNITEVIIPDTVVTVGYNAFAECDNLEKVTFGSNVTTLIGRTFYNSRKLHTVVWNDKIQKIGKEAFYDCYGLNSMTLPDSVTTLGEYIFYGCKNLESVKLSENLTELPQAAFNRCFALKSIVIPDSVQRIGKMAFSMTTFYVGEESALESVVIGKGVKSIGYEAFNQCESLTTVEMNDVVETIEYGAFKNCKKLQSMVIPDTTVTIGERAFYECESLSELTLGNSIETIGTCAFEDCAITEIVLPDTVTTIGVQAFQGCDKATYVKIGSGVQKIDSRAFMYCGMEDIVIPDSVTYLGQEAFSCCTNAKTLTIGSGITELREKTFYHCTSLEAVSIGAGLTTIGAQVFTDCNSMKAFTVDGNNPNFSNDDRGVLFNKDKTRLIQAPGAISGTYAVPDGVTIVGEWAFYECNQIENLVFPDSLKTLERHSFYGCDNLRHVDYGNGLEEAPGSMTFAYCHKLTETNLPLSFKTIGPLMYHGCMGLENIVIPDGVETIGEEAFSFCTNLKSVKFGSSVREIKKDAFKHCEYLEWISVGVALKTVGDGAFYRNDSLTDVYYAGSGAQWADVDIYIDVPNGNYRNGCLIAATIHCAGDHVHAYVPTVVVPTCTVQGYTTYTCECGNTYVDDYVAALDHDKVIDTAVAPTCTTEGKTGGEHCARCGKILTAQAIIPATGHSHTAVVTAPTCTAQGYTTHTCACGDVYTNTYTTALGHTVVDDAAVAPTCAQTGKTAGKHCSVCGEVLVAQEIIPTIAHSYESAVTAPNCTDKGYTTYTCSCGASYKDNYTDVLGHTYVDGSCSVCGDTVISAPVAKVANVTSSGKPKITWNAVEGAVKYEVYRATSKQGTYSLKKTTTSFSFTDTGATAGKNYYYKVRAIDANDNYADSNIVGRTCDLAQTKVTLTNVASTGKIKISWDAVEGATKYEVYRAASKNGSYSRISTTSNTSVTNTKAEAGKTYYYKVRAICSVDAATAAYSVVKSATCDLAQTKVTLTNKESTGKIVISWDAVEGATKYEVYRATSKNGTYSCISTTSNTSVTNTKTDAGKTYYYKVRAICDVSEAAAAYSAVKSCTCDLAQTKITLTNVASTGKIKISWDKVSGAVKYEVWRATSKTGTYKKITTVTGTSVTNTSAEAGKTYYYKVVAVAKNTAANSAASAVKSLTCDLAQPSVSITTSSGKPKVSWKKVDGATKYEVYRATSKTGTYSKVKTTTSLNWKDAGAVKNKTYYYKVVAVCSNTAGNSAYSSIVSIKATK